MIAAVPVRDISIRTAQPNDQAFVAATWAEQLTRGHHADANAIVDRALDSDTTRVLVALENHRIVGWLAYAAIPRVRAVLFAYVRRNDRLQGVARSLADAAWPQYAPGPRVMGGAIDVAGGRGAWVHAGLRGGSTKSLLQRFQTTQMTLEDLL